MVAGVLMGMVEVGSCCSSRRCNGAGKNPQVIRNDKIFKNGLCCGDIYCISGGVGSFLLDAVAMCIDGHNGVVGLMVVLWYLPCLGRIWEICCAFGVELIVCCRFMNFVFHITFEYIMWNAIILFPCRFYYVIEVCCIISESESKLSTSTVRILISDRTPIGKLESAVIKTGMGTKG